jgi:hypothetical protein
MIGFGYGMAQFKQGFFDARKVEKAADRCTLRALSKFGAFTRRRARTSMKRKPHDQHSLPGQPPYAHGAALLRTGILVAQEGGEGNRSVVIGPVKLNQRFFDGAGNVLADGVPFLLEYGGATTFFEEFIGDRWRRIDLRFAGNKANVQALQGGSETNQFQSNARRSRPTRKRTALIAARPYMNPAFNKELERAPYLWENGIRAA